MIDKEQVRLQGLYHRFVETDGVMPADVFHKLYPEYTDLYEAKLDMPLGFRLYDKLVLRPGATMTSSQFERNYPSEYAESLKFLSEATRPPASTPGQGSTSPIAEGATVTGGRTAEIEQLDLARSNYKKLEASGTATIQQLNESFDAWEAAAVACGIKV